MDTHAVRARAVSFDLDSTLADTRQRQWMVPMIRGDVPNPDGYTWDDYSVRCADDDPIEATIVLLRALYFGGNKILITTGRSELAMDLTMEWLNKHFVPYNELSMRPVGYHVPNAQLKMEHIAAFEGATGAHVRLHIDDWAEVSDTIREVLGIPTITIPGPFLVSEPALASEEKG